ncbi:hypothetical protein [Nostoc sp.]
MFKALLKAQLKISPIRLSSVVLVNKIADDRLLTKNFPAQFVN